MQTTLTKMEAAISRAKAFQKIKELTEKMQNETGIMYRPLKKIVTDKFGFAKVIEVPSDAMISLLEKRDAELTNGGYFDVDYNVN